MTEDYKETAESKGNSPKDQLSTRNVGALFFGIPSDCCSFSAPASIMKFSSLDKLASRMSRRKMISLRRGNSLFAIAVKAWC